jgi:hypothetical protein
MTLTGDQEAYLLMGARCVPDDMRDKYFALVADELRDQKRWRNGEVKAAVCAARQKCCAPVSPLRTIRTCLMTP